MPAGLAAGAAGSTRPWRASGRSGNGSPLARGHVGNVRVSDPYQIDIPVALRVDFAAGPVWMVAGIPQYPEMREVFVPGDEIMVVFTAERMRQIGFPDSEFLTPSRD
jgi:hypothetical protein